jgi:predicted amidohydrolase
MSRSRSFLAILAVAVVSWYAALSGSEPVSLSQNTPPATEDSSPFAQSQSQSTIRVGAAQPSSRLIDHRLKNPSDVLAQVDRSLDALEQIVEQAGAAGCDVLALPEDTLGLGTWEAGNPSLLPEVLPTAVERMLDRLGRAAASYEMYLVCCNDTVDAEGAVRNTAFFLGRDGSEIGRYHKVNMPIHELYKVRGEGFPVFETGDLGNVGMLICYDMVFPESARCLALGGADIVFHPTLGGAAIGDDDISRAAFRTRAAENFVYVVVSQRGGGSMIISPRGDVLAEETGGDKIIIADIDPNGGREGGDAFNYQRDMRARLFRERSPEAFGILTDPHPPVLDLVPATISTEDAVRIANAGLTVGGEEFEAADALLREGETAEAEAAFQELIDRYPATWIDRVSRERLAQIRDARDEQ